MLVVIFNKGVGGSHGITAKVTMNRQTNDAAAAASEAWNRSQAHTVFYIIFL